MRILGWAAWVDTKTGTEIYSSKETEWADLPDDGIIFIMLYKDEGDGQVENLTRYTHRENMSGVDHYFMAPHSSGMPIYGSNNDSITSIKKRYPGAIIKKGKWIPHELFQQIRMDAIKHGW